MTVSITKKNNYGSYSLRRTICIDSDDCSRAADIEISHYPRIAERQYAVTLYKADGKTLDNIEIASWQEAKKLALLWVEG